ncbi:MAG: hypothetical protein ACE5EE_06510 [Fidelibacterota bacterium]
MSLPTEINAPPDFSAGDTTYLMLSPIWDNLSHDLLSPIEISIAPDGHLFVADSAAHQIHVLGQDGEILEGFDALRNLVKTDGTIISPIDVDVDGKMNVFFIEGDGTIYRWNQLWNQIGVDSLASAGTFLNTISGDTLVLTPETSSWLEIVNSEEWEMIAISWTSNLGKADSILTPHVFFDATSEEAQFDDIYYNSEQSEYSGLSTSNQDNFLYVMDSFHDRLVRIDFRRRDLLLLKNGQVVWAHDGTFGHTAVGWGTGAGTVNDPIAIDVDYAGNIYYAQLGNYFSIHKINPSSSDGYVSYPSVFQEGENDIMDLGRFSNPMDVAVDQKQAVYIANAGAQEIQVFNADGSFFMKAGVNLHRIEKSKWNPGSSAGEVVDSTETDGIIFYVIEEKGILESPQAVAVNDQKVIYVCDTPNSRIVRYALSNTLDEDLVDNP